MENIENSINYIEFALRDLAATQDFYSKVFGWNFTQWGSDYISFSSANVEGGFNREVGVAPGTPGTLVILYTNKLEEKLESIKAGGAKINRDIYSFPGGRRFHFEDPNGNELAVWSEK